MFIAVLLSYVQFPFLCVKQEHVPLLLPFYLVASHSPFCVKRIEHCRPGCWKSTNYYCQGGALGTWSVSASHQPVINCCCAVRLLWECWSVPTAMHTANSVPSTDSLRTLSCWPAAWAGLPPVCWAGMMESLWNQQLFYAFLVVHLMVPLSETTGACCWHGRYFERQVLALCSVQHYLFSILSRPFPSRGPDGTKDSLQLGNEGSPRTSRYRHTLTRKATSPGPPHNYCRSVSHLHQKIRRETDRQT